MSALVRLIILSVILIIGAFMIGCGKVSNQTLSDVITTNGFLRVDGNIIKDSTNQIIHLKGFCLTNGVYTESTTPTSNSDYLLTSTDYNVIQTEMGANVVRYYLQYSWMNNTANFFSYMDKQLELIDSANLKVILSLHYFGTGSGGGFYNGTQANTSELVSFWKNISDRYSPCNVIAGYDLLNEPYCSGSFTETTLYSIYETIVAEIRNNNDKHIIFISDPVNKYDNPTASYFNLVGDDAFKKLSDSNIVYQFHWYKPIKFTHQTVYDNGYFQLGANYPYQENSEDYTGGWYQNTAKTGNTAGSWVTVTSDWLDVDDFIRNSTTVYSSHKMGLSILVGNANGNILIDNIRVERTTNTSNPAVTVYVPNSDFSIPRRYNIHTTTSDTRPANWYLIASTNGIVAEHPGGTLENGYLKFNPTGIVWGTGSWATWKTSWWDGYHNYLDYTYGQNYKYRAIMDVNTNLSGGSTVWSAFEFYNIGTPALQNKSFIETAISNYYVSWANANNVPLYCGEWGVADPSQGIGMINAFPNAPNHQINWINDMADILSNKSIHWTYHDYKNYDKLGFGVFDTNSHLDIKQALQNAF